jgi:hypothetical protein
MQLILIPQVTPAMLAVSRQRESSSTGEGSASIPDRSVEYRINARSFGNIWESPS